MIGGETFLIQGGLGCSAWVRQHHAILCVCGSDFYRFPSNRATFKASGCVISLQSKSLAYGDSLRVGQVQTQLQKARLGHPWMFRNCEVGCGFAYPDPPTLVLLKKARETPKKGRVFLFAEPLEKRPKNQGISENEKSQGNERSKGWRVRVAHRNCSDFAICDCDAHRGPQKSLAISETRQNNVALPFKGAMESR